MRQFLLLVLLLPLAATADERILNFHSDVRVFSDGMVEVTETIQVRAEGKQIRRGIYRDFPVDYKDRLGIDYRLRLEPLAVLRDGNTESWHAVRGGRDVRVYFGSKNRFLDAGEYTYTFRYRVDRTLGYFEQHDEIYWNVTGHEWAFPIDKASATVRLEFDAPRDAILVEGYTGRFGSNEQDYGRYLDDNGAVHFQANRPLPVAHGLTIVVGWPKGFVTEPTVADKIGWVIKDNSDLLVALLCVIALLAYYIPTWRSHGKDPEPGVVVTRYEPPQGFSPASLRYIRQMYYDNKVMTAAIVNLAVKGYVEIVEADGKHSLRRRPAADAVAALAPGEKELYDALFADGDDVALENDNHEILGGARDAHRMSLEDDYKRNYFKTNGWLNVPPVLILIISVVIAIGLSNGPSVPVIGTFIVAGVLLVWFAVIMRRPTLRGRKLLDEMEGFSDYLDVAEKDELNLRNPPEKTPQLFEALLPYALALGVEQGWSDKFAAVLAAIRNPDGSEYSPDWYRGNWNTRNLSRTTNGFTRGLNRAVASSVTPPGSSSGGGGGGFSGGGGGGGGGGGW